ncbi:MAG: hypothetical protein IPH56_13470 [Chitinophagaceae bacterium]|nr:hypothetical protein [Chitinophagaceae bacterium]
MMLLAKKCLQGTKDLDGDKNYFSQADIDAFNKYGNKIDDEIHGSPLESFFMQ